MNGGSGQILEYSLMAAAVIGTGGAAIGAIAPAAFAGGTAAVAATADTAAVAAVPGFFAANASIFSGIAGLASAGMQVGSGIMAGQAAKFEQQQIETEQQMQETQAATDRAQRELKLNQILSSQTALYAARGVALGSGSSLTEAQNSISQANSDQNVAGLNSSLKEQQLSDTSSQKALEAQSAQTGGFARAGISLLSTAKSGGFGA